MPGLGPLLGGVRELLEDAINAPRKDVSTLTKAAIIIGAILLFAGVAAASSLTSTGGNSAPTIDVPTLSTPGSGSAGQDDRQAEDISGPCDEAEHAGDPRCTGTAGAMDDQRGDEGDDDQRGDDGDRHNSGPGNAEDNSGHQEDGNSGRGGGDDD